LTKTYPEVAQKGAYTPSVVYNPEDMTEIVEYARLRGIRVVLEIDMPGHSASWSKAFPNMTAYCPGYMGNINNIPLNPTTDFTYDVLKNIFKELVNYFPDNYLHTGGDELILGCWSSDASIAAWLKMRNMTTTQLEQYFETNLDAILQPLKKTKIVWQEVYSNGISLPPNTIVQVWKDSATVQKVVNSGLRALISFPWYLDKQVPDPPSVHYGWVDTWQDFYNFEPYTNITSNVSRILGGEPAMWGEQVDGVNFDSRVWPRACGPAERLWSPQSVHNVTDAISRLILHRCRLAQRGIGAGPIAPDYCPLPP